MAVTLATTPEFAFPGRVRLTVGLTGGGNYARAWVTDAPESSELRALLDAAQASSRIEVFTASAAPEEQPTIEFDRGGVYTFSCQEYTLGATTYGGGFAGDPDSFQSETKVGAENTVSIYIGQRLESRVGSPTYGVATLTLWVWDNTVRGTSNLEHGVVSPNITLPSTQKAVTAINDPTVQAALDALVNATASDLIGDLAGLVDEFKSDLPSHFSNTGGAFHSAADSDNDTEIEDMPSNPQTPAAVARAANVVRKRLDLHMTNDSDGSARYHVIAGINVPDMTNRIIAGPPATAADMASSVIALADAFRAYEAHRVDTDSHLVADAVNVISPLTVGSLLSLHHEFLNAMRGLTPAGPTTINQGATDLVHTAGFIDTTGSA